MIRGAIDNVTPHEISGWLYNGGCDTRGRKVLAFYDQICIGAGELKEFRQDLVDAGLGDGFHGFRFDIAPPDRNRLGSIVVRLEGDETIMVQKDSRVVGRFDPPDIATGTRAGPDRAPLLQWMRGRNWLDQGQFDFLWFLDQLGVYNRMLTAAEQAHVAGGADGSLAMELLELYHMAEIAPARQVVRTAAELTNVLRKVVLVGMLEPVVAVWSGSTVRFRLVEASHRELSRGAAGSGAEGPPLTNHVLGPNRLLFFNARCQIEAAVGDQGLTVFYASGLHG